MTDTNRLKPADLHLLGAQVKRDQHQLALTFGEKNQTSKALLRAKKVALQNGSAGNKQNLAAAQAKHDTARKNWQNQSKQLDLSTTRLNESLKTPIKQQGPGAPARTSAPRVAQTSRANRSAPNAPAQPSQSTASRGLFARIRRWFS